jgi:hypothetical protein
MSGFLERLSLLPDFTELAGKYEYDAGMSRSDAEARATLCPAPDRKVSP